MMLFEEHEKVRALLREAVTVLCRNGLTFSSELTVEGLLGITLDNQDVFLVNINEQITAAPSGGETVTSKNSVTSNKSATPGGSSSKVRKRPRETPAGGTGKETPSGGSGNQKTVVDEPNSKKVKDSVTSGAAERPGGGTEVESEGEQDDLEKRVKQEKTANDDDHDDDNSKDDSTHGLSDELNLNVSVPHDIKPEPDNNSLATETMTTDHSAMKDKLDDDSNSSDVPITIATEDEEVRLEPGTLRVEPFSPEKLPAGMENIDWCAYCGKTFSSKSSLKDHVCHEDQKWYQCQVCGKQLGTKEGFARHMNHHTGNFKHRCTICDKGFNRPYELKRHMGQKHGKKGGKETN